MEFAFSNEQKLISIKQELELLNSEKSSEKVAFAEKLVSQGWIEFKKETVYDYGDTYLGYWWVVHPSVAELYGWEDPYCDSEKCHDSSLYYDLL